jgi:hypothetical protein
MTVPKLDLVSQVDTPLRKFNTTVDKASFIIVLHEGMFGQIVN